MSGQATVSDTPPTPRPLVSVVVPVVERPVPLDVLFNEHASSLARAGMDAEFVFVIQPWGMDLAADLRPLVADGARIVVLQVGRGVGESDMLTAARARCRGNVLVTLPAYRRIEPDQLPRLVQAVIDGADLSTARRTTTSGSLFNRLQNKVFHALLRVLVGSSLTDVASGVRAMRPTILDELPVYGDFFRFLPILAEREGFEVREVDLVQHSDDARTRIYPPGIYLRRFIDLLGLFFLVRFVRKPLRFFGLVGVVTSGVGVLVLTFLLVERIGGQSLADRPMLLLGVLLFVLGVQSIGIGLVGEIIVHLNTGSGRTAYRAEIDEPE